MTTTPRPNPLPGFILERTAKRMKQFFQQQLQLRELGLTVDQWLVLHQLHQRDGQYLYELADTLFKDRPTTKGIIDRLAAKGYLRRQADPHDRRRNRLHLTDAGHRKVRETAPIMEALRERAWSALRPEEVSQLLGLLERVFAQLEEE